MTTNKIALVTGGSRGLGREMALRLAKGGDAVIITYQSQQAKADEVVNEIEIKGGKARAVYFDAGNIPALGKFIDEIKKVLSEWNATHLDYLINNAGIGATIPFEKATEDEFDKFLNIHFKSVYFLCQRMLPMLNNNGRIINISTGTTRFVNPGYSIYASMKGAIEVFTRYLAKEVGSRGITANVIAPGPIETDFNNATIKNAPAERRSALVANTALGRFGQAEDIAGIVAFLCSADAGWITGQRIEASGGINL